jgi:glutaredoxin
MRTSFRLVIAAILVLGHVVAASAIEPVGSASRGTAGESSRRTAAPVETQAAPAAVAAKVPSGAKNIRPAIAPKSAAPQVAQPKAMLPQTGSAPAELSQSASAQLAAVPLLLPADEAVPTPDPVSAPQSVAALSPTARAGGPFGWQTNVEEACRLARQHNLPVLVFVTSAHCPYCTKMKEQTFRTAAVINEVDANFVPLKIERGSAPAFERYLGIKSYPTTIVLRGDKAEMARMAGFIQAPQFVGNLKKIESQWPVMSASRSTTRR